tara:strand:+ start:223 stop:627 length:405 start_codon:yes stop_codon:yes gene_type:complete
MPNDILIDQPPFKLVQVDYEKIAPFKNLAAKERVSLAKTQNTLWFHVMHEQELAGVCGIYLTKSKCRLKGDWVLPQARGVGCGGFMSNARMQVGRNMDYSDFEVLTVNPEYYKNKGFNIIKETHKGVFLAVKSE